MRMMRNAVVVSALLLACSIAVAQNAAPAAASTHSMATSTNPTEIGQFQTIEDKWSTAENKHDQYGLDLVLSPLLVNVGEDGNITTHDQQIVKAITNDDKMYYLSQKVVTVRMLGDVAVVNGTYTLRHREDSGKVVVDNGVFTHVFQQQRGRWSCINAQRTLVNEAANTRSREKAREKKPAAKGSSFSLHVPFFGKGDK